MQETQAKRPIDQQSAVGPAHFMPEHQKNGERKENEPIKQKERTEQNLAKDPIDPTLGEERNRFMRMEVSITA